jgi:hypothetical protein
MSRTRRPPSSAEIEAEIQRLTEERARALASEDQRRGELLRGYLAGPRGAELRAALAPLVGRRDVLLFGLNTGSDRDTGTPATTTPAVTRQVVAAAVT